MVRIFWMIFFTVTTSESGEENTTQQPLDFLESPDCFKSALQEYYYGCVGELFEVTCELNNLSDNNSINYLSDQLLWYKQGREGSAQQSNDWNEVVSQRGKNFFLSSISRADAGTYLCLLRNSGLCLKAVVLSVKKQNQTGCQDTQSSEVIIIRQRSATISCPGIQHFNSSERSPVKWFKNGELVEERDYRYSLILRNDQIYLQTVYEEDSGNYTCTFKFFENKIPWLVKRTLTINVMDPDTTKPPTVIDPHGVKTIEIEIGSSVQLTCKVSFGFEKKFSPVIKWLTYEGEMENQGEYQRTEKNKEFLLTREAKLNEVTAEDFNTNFTCFSQNSQGNSSGVLRLKEKESSTFQIKVITISTSLIFVVIVSGFVGVYKFWLEIVLLYRHYFSKDETIGDGKEFDAFVSYASSCSSGEDVESDGYSITEEKFALELLPSILEEQYGYKLCLFERDILPGGVYTEDIILCIKRSRRVIIVLSPNYFASAKSRLFELQTGVNTMLDNFKTKVILINFHGLPHGTDLPDNVKRAIAVLPEIMWKGNKSSHPSSKFWKVLRYYMPVKKKELCEKNEMSKALI